MQAARIASTLAAQVGGAADSDCRLLGQPAAMAPKLWPALRLCPIIGRYRTFVSSQAP